MGAMALAGWAGWAHGAASAPSAPTAPLPAPPQLHLQDWQGEPLLAPDPAREPGHRIVRITLHHQGEVWPSPQRPDDEPRAYLQRLQSWSRLSKRWPDIPYHHVIAPDGRIYATRDLGLPGDTNTEYDPRGHALVMLMGNFEVQQPTPAQLESAVALMAWLAQAHGLSAQAIASHKDYSGQTVCPGASLYAQLDGLRAAVQARLDGAAR